MADCSADAEEMCIRAVVGDGMKLQFALKKYGLTIGCKDAQYHRIRREIVKREKEIKQKASKFHQTASTLQR